MESRDKLLAELAEIERHIPVLESGAVTVGEGRHEAYMERMYARRAELRSLVAQPD